MPGTRISIILPNYNSEKYLEKCIQSFLDQEYDNKELVIVDGKSTDASHAIIESFCAANTNIIWVKEKDKNVTDGFNIGLEYATGDFIGFLASDSMYYDPHIFRTIAKTASKIDIDCIYFNAYSYFLNEKKVVLRNCGLSFDRDTLLTTGCFIPFENIYFKAGIYKRYRLDINYNLSSDIEFYLRVLGDQPVSIFVNKVSTINYYDGGNLSVVHGLRQYQQWIKVDIKSLFDYDIIVTDKYTLHQSLIMGDYTLNRKFIKQAEAWFIELFNANDRTGFYSHNAMIKKFYPYWDNLLLAGRKYGLFTFLMFVKSPVSKKVARSKAETIKFFLGCLIKSAVFR